MGKVVGSFLEYLILQVIVTIIGMNVVREKDRGVSGIFGFLGNSDISDILESWIFGQMLCFAVLQIMAVPMIFVHLSFDTLFWSYTAVCAVLFSFGCWRAWRVWKDQKVQKKNLSSRKSRLEWNWLAAVLLFLAIVLILYQAGNYLFKMHLDEDDARWLAQANDALEYGDMMIRNWDTGDYLGFIQVPKDATSPWPMMIAIVSKLLGTGTAVFSHTIYASIELLLMYAVYWLIGKELFKKTESRCTFILMIAVLNLFFGMTFYTQATFSLVRIWQGKASVAAVIMPLLLYLFLRIHRQDTVRDWLKVMITCCAACLMSGMGISLSAIVIGVYGAWYILAYRKWKRIPMLVLSVLPSVCFLLIYTSLRSLF